MKYKVEQETFKMSKNLVKQYKNIKKKKRKKKHDLSFDMKQENLTLLKTKLKTRFTEEQKIIFKKQLFYSNFSKK